MLCYISGKIFMQVLVAMFELLQDIWRPFKKETEEQWEGLCQELNKATTGLSISPVERDEIVAAMKEEGISGHWYSCPNGHVYNIGDCGGAMEVGVEILVIFSISFMIDEQMSRVQGNSWRR